MPQIHETAIVHPKAELGAGVKVGPYAVIGKNVILGDGCEIGPHVVIEGRTRMGARNRVFTGAVIGSMPQDLKYRGEVSYASLGGLSGVPQFVSIGSYCMVGGLTKIVQDVLPFCMVDGNPARGFGLNRIGLKRRGFEVARIRILEECYKIVFRTQLKRQQAREEILARADLMAEPLVQYFLSCFDRVEWGITR